MQDGLTIRCVEGGFSACQEIEYHEPIKTNYGSFGNVEVYQKRSVKCCFLRGEILDSWGIFLKSPFAFLAIA
jgi:hypothetical protein